MGSMVASPFGSHFLEAAMSLMNDRASRRNFLLSAAPAIAGGLALSSAAPDAFAQPSGSQTEKSAGSEKMWSKEYWAQKGDVKLYLYRKRAGVPQAGKPALPVLFLVHGSSTSSAGFDLTVPGHGEYSLMDAFAQFGYDVWTMDFTGYGKSSRGEGNSNIADGVEDLNAALPVVAH